MKIKHILFDFFAVMFIFCTANVFAQVEFGLENQDAPEQIEDPDLITDTEPKIFEFKFKKNDMSRILSTVNEDIYINGRFSHHADILNRISAKITEVTEDGKGKAEAVFMTSENSTGEYGRNFSWGEEYKSIFTRTKSGVYEIEDIYFMPTVRDVPVFPERAVKPGDKWTADGHEAHDLRRNFGIQKPFKVPFTASYEYKGDKVGKDGNILSLIEVKYNLYFESPLKKSALTADMKNLPAMTMGRSNQNLWWDNNKGMIVSYNETFRIIIQTFTGDTIIFQGDAEAELTEFNRSSTEENLEKITDTVQELGLKDVTVKKSDKGLTISIENINFMPDSAELIEEEKTKLRHIADILKRFDNDILVTGHCAKRGTLRSQMELSEQRAAAVALFLTQLNVRLPNCIYTQGKGAEEPIAPNTTEAGRKRNRRVEITLMDE
ncbi:MAG: OmpA family protein [Treponema sp.]